MDRYYIYLLSGSELKKLPIRFFHPHKQVYCILAIGLAEYTDQQQQPIDCCR